RGPGRRRRRRRAARERAPSRSRRRASRNPRRRRPPSERGYSAPDRPTRGSIPLPAETASRDERQIERREEAGRGGADGADRVHEPRRREKPPSDRVVAALVPEFILAAHARIAPDEHAVAAATLRPVGREVVVDARHVLDDDRRLPADDSLHLEAE